MSFSKDKRQETVTYLALWGTLFIAPVLSLYVRTAGTDAGFDWSEVLTVWRPYAVFLAIFLVHNHLLAPLLVYQQRRALYFSLVGALVAGFWLYQCASRPDHMDGPGGPGGPRHEQMMAPHHERPDGPPPFEPGDDFDRNDDFDRDERPKRRPVAMMEQHDVIALVILVLMLGMNVGIKLYFKQRRDQKALLELERENLEQQLEYLKYQVNPHFFMNTLNNIHALVDIDPEKAKQTIVELSKMMRFVLYEGNKQGVPLSREIAFLENYVELMKLRYTDKVRITFEKPMEAPPCELPPLMLITFVENAFKHGVSYRQASFIDIRVEAADGRLRFHCANSRIPKEDDQHGGVGLANVKKRLELIYGKDYTLNIADEPDTYTVDLTIPANKSTI